MPKNKVLQRPHVEHSQHRSEADRSFVANFSALCGQLGVAMAQPVIAGTKGVLNRRVFTRTSKVVNPAFQNVTEHFDFFLVPLTSLWSAWENWKLNINDLKSSAWVPWDSTNSVPDLALPTNAPRFDFNGFVSALGYAATNAGVAEINDAFRLLEYCGYGHPNTFGSATVMNLFKLAAYHKCYMEHYRNTSYESLNPYICNLDWLYESNRNGLASPSTDTVAAACMKEMLKIHRVNYRNDYFHNVYPSLNYVVSLPSGLDWKLPSDVVGNTGGLIGPLAWFSAAGAGSSYQQSAAITVATPSGSTPNYGISAQSIRAMFALDKLMRASAYAPKHVSDQYKARFGVEVKEDDCHISQRLGSFQNDIIFQDSTPNAS